MIAHIDAAMVRLKDKMEKKDQEYKYKIIHAIYIEGKTYEQVSAEFNCSEATARRWKNEAVNELGVQLFGAEGFRVDF